MSTTRPPAQWMPLYPDAASCPRSPRPERLVSTRLASVIVQLLHCSTAPGGVGSAGRVRSPLCTRRMRAAARESASAADRTLLAVERLEDEGLRSAGPSSSCASRSYHRSSPTCSRLDRPGPGSSAWTPAQRPRRRADPTPGHRLAQREHRRRLTAVAIHHPQAVVHHDHGQLMGRHGCCSSTHCSSSHEGRRRT